MTRGSSRNAEALVAAVAAFWRNSGNRPEVTETPSISVSRQLGVSRSGGRWKPPEYKFELT